MSQSLSTSKSKTKSSPSRKSSQGAALTLTTNGKTSLSIFNKISSFHNLAEELELMNESELKERLREVNEELADYKNKVQACKKENEKLRQEIENSHKDSAEYSAYLEHKKAEKQSMLGSINAEHERAIKGYRDKKESLERKLSQQVEELNLQIDELEAKLQSKNQEILSLADILRIRQKHESQLDAYQEELKKLTQDHAVERQALERTLLEERLRLKKATEENWFTWQSEAQAQAIQTLTEETRSLATENEQMEVALKQAVKLTQAYVQRQSQLQQQYQRLVTEKKLQARVHQLRLTSRSPHPETSHIELKEEHQSSTKKKRSKTSKHPGLKFSFSQMDAHENSNPIPSPEVSRALIELVNEKTKSLYTPISSSSP